jgi:glycosyltransferase involved in cell wall biosynthesis
LFVLASRVEGFGLPIAEAIACGAPAVCSDSAAMPEVLALPEACFDPSCPASVAAALDRGLRDRGLRRRLIERGKERRPLFTWPSTVDRLMAAIESTVPRADRRVAARSAAARAW